MTTFWIILAVIAYLALGVYVGSALRSARKAQTRPVAPVQQVRDEKLDITPALRRSSR